MTTWRRLMNLRVTEEWTLTPSFRQQTVRLTYGYSDNCHSILVGRSPNLYPVQLFGQRSFIVKPQSEVWVVPSGAPLEFDALAFKALPQVQDRPTQLFVLIDVLIGSEPDPQPPDEASWTDATLLNGWENYGPPFFPVGYIKFNGIVYLRGILSGSSAVDGHIFSLPEGCQPEQRLLFSIASGGDYFALVPARIDIDPSGEVVKFDGSLNYLSLDGIFYKV